MADSDSPAKRSDPDALAESRAPGSSAPAKASEPAAPVESRAPGSTAPAKASEPAASAADSRASGSGAPATDEIDSEWPSTAEATPPPSATTSQAPRTEEVDSGWLGEARPRAPADLIEPKLPPDPEVPSDMARVSSKAPKASKGKSSAPPAGSDATELQRPSVKAKAADSGEERRVSRYSQPAAPTQKGGSRWIGLFLLLLAVGVIVVVKLAGRTSDEPAAEKPVSGATGEVKAASPPEVTEARIPAPPEPAASAPVVAAEAPLASASSDAVAAAPAPSEAPALPSTAPSAAADGKKRVVIDVMPPNARIFYKGKDAGKPPVTIELEPGKRRSFEVAAPGYTTRKVVIDGSKPEVTVGLRPVPASTDAPPPP